MRLGDMFPDLFSDLAEQLEEEAAEAEAEEAGGAEPEEAEAPLELEEAEELEQSDADFLASTLDALSSALMDRDWAAAEEEAQTLHDVVGALDPWSRDIVEGALGQYDDALERVTSPEFEYQEAPTVADDLEARAEAEPEALDPFDLASEIATLYEWAASGELDAATFAELSEPLFNSVLDLASHDALMAGNLWDSLVDIDKFERGETLGIGWDAEGAPVFEAGAEVPDDSRDRGMFDNELDAQAFVAEIGVDAFIIVHEDDGWHVIEIGTGGNAE